MTVLWEVVFQFSKLNLELSTRDPIFDQVRDVVHATAVQRRLNIEEDREISAGLAQDATQAMQSIKPVRERMEID